MRDLQDQFGSRCRRIVYEISDTGWGFDYKLGEIYDEHLAQILRHTAEQSGS